MITQAWIGTTYGSIQRIPGSWNEAPSTSSHAGGLSSEPDDRCGIRVS
jgi:hypothetical protein